MEYEEETGHDLLHEVFEEHRTYFQGEFEIDASTQRITPRKKPQKTLVLMLLTPIERSTKRLAATVLTTIIAILLVAGISVLAFSGTVAADSHTVDEAPTYSTTEGEANFTINLPQTIDHYPGDHEVHSEQNGYNASIEYFATGEAAFDDNDAREGIG